MRLIENLKKSLSRSASPLASTSQQKYEAVEDTLEDYVTPGSFDNRAAVHGSSPIQGRGSSLGTSPKSKGKMAYGNESGRSSTVQGERLTVNQMIDDYYDEEDAVSVLSREMTLKDRQEVRFF